MRLAADCSDQGLAEAVHLGPPRIVVAANAAARVQGTQNLLCTLTTDRCQPLSESQVVGARGAHPVSVRALGAWPPAPHQSMAPATRLSVAVHTHAILHEQCMSAERQHGSWTLHQYD